MTRAILDVAVRRRPYTLMLTDAEKAVIHRAAQVADDPPSTFARKAIARGSAPLALADLRDVPPGTPIRHKWNLGLSLTEEAALHNRAQAAALGPRVWARAIVLATARQVLGEEASNEQQK